MYLLAPFILQNFKKNSYAQSKVVRMCHLQVQNDPICHEQNFFGTNHCYYFHLHIRPFHCAKFKKFLLQIQSYDAPFLGPKWSICPKQIFFGKLLNLFSSTYQPLSLCTFLKKFFQRIQSYEDAQFLGPKWPISPDENFFRKPVNEPCFFHSCLSTCQKSKSDINLIVT